MNPARRGLTLLELLLATALAVVILTIISTAIDFHLRVLGSGRRDVEQAQLARTLLQNIASDLRGAVAYDPMNAASMLPAGLGVSLPGKSAAGDLPGSTAGDPTGGLTGGANGSVAERSEDDTSLVMETTVGLYGTANWLQVDVSRLPRLDQFAQATAPVEGSTLRDRTSEVKTVAYFVAPPTDNGAPGGLVRRELDRAVTSWATQQGSLPDLEQQLEPLAPEVAEIAFRYFDGAELVDFWDMDQRQALPMAVEVVLRLKSSDPNKIDPIAYRLWVHLPTAVPSSLDDTSTETSEPTDSATPEEETPVG